MRQITKVLRLNAQRLSYRQIAQSVGISASTVQSYLERAQRAGLSWPLPDEVDEAGLEARLFTRTQEELRPGRPEPNWLEVHRQRKTRQARHAAAAPSRIQGSSSRRVELYAILCALPALASASGCGHAPGVRR